ncbi:uncharacterized protein LOC129725780 isoform X2 [Wyeomyia smithii]|uniref:uncharacterized protein LOC129725780 isoform X2 n=1 Tax=Wyeomyia smithii TaxID=174621 RepID=UPI00246800DA|nr:uncharacterized protein LOC129725780 isoform X2 [Wyeomyia smithii]
MRISEINSSMILMFLMSTSLALPTDNTQQKLNRVKRSFLSSYFWKSTEPSVPAVENIQSIENSQTIFAVPRSVNSNVPPSFVPVIPLQHFVSAAGQHFIAVKPVNVAGPNWILDNLVEQPKPHNPLKKPSKTPLDLTPSEVTELNQLARVIGVRDLNDLPPLEEVMTLLGTTSKSETIKAIRDYASTPGGLELIKEYVDSYQPVKRMDLLEKEISNNLVSNPRVGEPSQGKAFNSNPPIAFVSNNPAESQDQLNATTPAQNTGFFAGLRSFFSLGSSTEPPKKTEESVNRLDVATENPIPVIGANYVPHFIIPMQPLLGNEHYYNLMGHPVKPAIQDMNPFVLKPHLPQYVSTTNPPSTLTGSQKHVAQVYHEGIPKIQKEALSVVQNPAGVSLAAESKKQLNVNSLEIVLASSVDGPVFQPKSDTAVSTETSSTLENTTVTTTREITTPINE